MEIFQLRRFAHWILACVLLSLTAFSACASGPALVDHAFSYDTWNDSPGTEVLNYRYSTDYPEDWQLRDEGIGQRRNVNGPMPRGDMLYAKWRIKATGVVYEDTVDLRKRLPANITDHRIHFVVKGPQLYVYLITPQSNPPGWPTYDPPGYTHKKTYVIYPDPTPPNRFN